MGKKGEGLPEWAEHQSAYDQQAQHLCYDLQPVRLEHLPIRVEALPAAIEVAVAA